MGNDSPNFATRASIFLQLNSSEPRPREVAWEEFRRRYAPIIAGFARKFGAHPQDVDDVIQDVLLGFFAQSPTFEYDPARGRFRGYLKVCTWRALNRRIGKNARFNGVPLDQIDAEAPQVEQTWNDVWERQLISRAIDAMRAELGFSRRFRAFEQHVILNLPAADVARELGVHVNSVYRAKQQLSEKLKETVAKLREED